MKNCNHSAKGAQISVPEGRPLQAENSPGVCRGVTLVELLLAAGIAIIGITLALTLAADVIQTGSNVKRKNSEYAEAQAALMRIRSELYAAKDSEQKNDILAITNESGSVRWQALTFGNTAILTRYPQGATPQLKYAVAKRVHGIKLKKSDNASTLAISVGSGQYKRKLEEVIRKWGQTL